MVAGRLLRVAGRVEREGQVVHLIAERIEDLSPMLLTSGEAISVRVGRQPTGRSPSSCEYRQSSGGQASRGTSEETVPKPGFSLNGGSACAFRGPPPGYYVSAVENILNCPVQVTSYLSASVVGALGVLSSSLSGLPSG